MLLVMVLPIYKLVVCKSFVATEVRRGSEAEYFEVVVIFEGMWSTMERKRPILQMIEGEVLVVFLEPEHADWEVGDEWMRRPSVPGDQKESLERVVVENFLQISVERLYRVVEQEY